MPRIAPVLLLLAATPAVAAAGRVVRVSNDAELARAVGDVKPGDTVPLTLKFSDGSTLATDFAARPANAVDAGEPHAAH